MISNPPSLPEFLDGLGTRYPVPPFRVTERTQQPPSAPDSAGRGDAIIGLEWAGKQTRFKVEFRTVATPKRIELALSQLRWASPRSELPVLLVAPYLNAEAFERLVAENVSGIDLSGNYAIVVPGQWLVLRTGAKNRYPSSAKIKNVYRGKSALVCRALIIDGEFASADAIRTKLKPTASISAGTVSKVLSRLEEELLVERDGRIRLLQPGKLLDNLTANYAGPKERGSVTGKIDSPDVLERLAENADRSGARYAVDSPARYTVMPGSDPITRIFADSIAKLLGDVRIDTMSRFPNVALVETADSAVYYDRRAIDGVFWTSPLQAYLELATGGKREQQSALAIREDLMALRYR